VSKVVKTVPSDSASFIIFVGKIRLVRDNLYLNMEICISSLLIEHHSLVLFLPVCIEAGLRV